MAKEQEETEEAFTPAAALADALFRVEGLIHLIVVAEDADGSIIVWRSNNTTMNAVGMLEAAKLQTLGVAGSKNLDEEEEDEGSG